jgi:thiosulfate dehydrogenase (quinone) large subunit
MSTTNTTTATNSTRTADWSYAHLILRLWVGMRIFFAGVDKFREKGGSTFSMEWLDKNMSQIRDGMETGATAILPKFSIGLFTTFLPWALLIVGAWAILGIATRLGLFAAGMLFVSLSVGLMALPDDNQVVMRGIEVAVTALALMTAHDNKWSLDGLLFRKKSA